MKKTVSLMMLFCGLAATITLSSCFDGSSPHSGEGYGEYHNVNTGERQSSYKGSVEQQNDIATLDKMIEDGY